MMGQSGKNGWKASWWASTAIAGVMAGMVGGSITAAHAEEKPFFQLEGAVEFQNEFAADSDDPEVKDYNQAFARTELYATLNLTEGLSLVSTIIGEQVRDPDVGESNFLEEEGLYIDEIYLRYEQDNWAVYGGKFDPAFGIAWDWGRGIWSEDFAEDYEVFERIGVGASANFDLGAAGQQEVAVATYFADTTFLSESFGKNREHVNEDDGGAANTESFESFLISLNGAEIPALPGFSYGIAYRHQAAPDDVEGSDEDGFVITLGHAVDLGNGIGLDAQLEYADIEDFDGTTGEDRQYFSASLITTIDESWNVTVGYTDRDIEVSGEDDINDHLFQLSAGYDFGQGTTAEIGWRSTEEEDVDTDIVGFLLRHQFSYEN